MMDVFKVLSRSSKLSNKKPNKSFPFSDLPSAGNIVNPQLYNDATLDSRGKKRKRGSEFAAEQTFSEDSVAYDFFAPPTAVSNPQKKIANYSESEPAHVMTENECRRILRSYRIKLTLLNINEDQKKICKKSKSEKEVKNFNHKKEYKNIYPQPLVSFSDLRIIYRISNLMLENIEEQGFKIPTEVQMASLPLLLKPNLALRDSTHEIDGQNINLLAIAPTGSGKTLAFLIPIIDQILQHRRQIADKASHVLEAIIVVPTKELADQILNEAKVLTKRTGVKVCGMRKGMRLVVCDESIQNVSADEDYEHVDTDPHSKNHSPHPITKVDILVTTPGLLLKSLSSGNPSTYYSLPTVRTLVLDEADVLLDPLFREQTLSIWSSLTSPHLCTTLWSATISSSVENLALSVIRRRFPPKKPVIRLVIGLKDSALPTISHTLTYCGTENGKLHALRNLLHPSSKGGNVSKNICPPIIIFTQTIPRATALHGELLYDIPPHAGGSSRIAVLHSSLSSTARSAVLKRFRNGEIWVLIATDLLSRGVDFRGVNAVVNYDIPNDAAGYIHRAGRTGRGGRKGGVAVTFYTQNDIPFIRGVVNVIEASRKTAESLDYKCGGEDTSWLLNVLPKLNKKEKNKLKVRGVEARRVDLNKNKNGNEEKDKTKNKGHANQRISTRSGYERKLENRKRGAIEASKIRSTRFLNTKNELTEEFCHDQSDWEGIDE